MKSLNKYLTCSFAACVVIYFVLLMNVEQTSAGILIWQIFSFVIFSISLYIAPYFTKRLLILYIFFYQLIMSFILQTIYLIDAGDIFGYSYVDPKFYSETALVLKNYSLIDSIAYLKRFDFDLSDFGFPLFLRWIYMIGDTAENSMHVLLVVNSVIQTWVTYLMYNLCEKLITDIRRIKTIVALWGLNTVSIFFNVSGLKEPLFLLLCMLVIYSLYKLTSEKKFLWNTVFFISVLSVWLFRYYMSLFFIIIYLCYVTFPFIYKNYFKWICIFSTVICIGFANVLENYFAEIYFAQLQVDEFNSRHGLLVQLNSYVLAFLAPIPKFFDLAYPQNLLSVVYSIEKFFLSIWGLVGSYYLIKNKDYTFYPLISIVLFTVLMMIVSNHSIDYRYPYVIMPSYFILIIAGTYYEVKWVRRAYSCYALLVIVVFNLQLF